MCCRERIVSRNMNVYLFDLQSVPVSNNRILENLLLSFDIREFGINGSRSAQVKQFDSVSPPNQLDYDLRKPGRRTILVRFY
jgi:hypothetical protein